MTDKDKIAIGECVSPLTVDRCPHCIDSCEAFKNRVEIAKSIKIANSKVKYDICKEDGKIIFENEQGIYKEIIDN